MPDRLSDACAEDEPLDSETRFAMAYCDGGCTANPPLADTAGGRAWVVARYDGQLPGPGHGGPARLLVPQLHFRERAKWVRGV